jgi:hypothetical protein
LAGSHIFQGLRTFCERINETIDDSLTQFYSSQYVNAFVIPSKLFELKTKSLLDQFRLSMINKFLLSFSMIRDATQANALLSRRVTVPDQRTELVFIVQFRSKERELVTSSFEKNWKW